MAKDGDMAALKLCLDRLCAPLTHRAEAATAAANEQYQEMVQREKRSFQRMHPGMSDVEAEKLATAEVDRWYQRQRSG
jgi:hypothetical protein